ncbi:hypothetical protein B0T17DRAFT_498800 [Bombardia bombarda]|uniref:F-box domain-containing protein n=1 Tax=Bombardia bombarda TaxID=252184 RepID=A0AA39WD30_9PEZI|nr:hypothetical protein B0T17DRAFT_498800 [Bombardia bombarda]
MDSQTPRLPPEIWLIILEMLPASFFQKNLRCLTVSKQWYDLAYPSFYSRIEFTPRVISRLVSRQSRRFNRSRAKLRETLRCLNIVLDGMGKSDPKNGCFDTVLNLGRLYAMLLDFKDLQAVSIQARWQNKKWKADPLQADYLPMRAIVPFVSFLENVKILDLDLRGTSVINGVTSDDQVHLCPFFRPLLNKLDVLRLRVRCICALAVLDMPDMGPLTVREITINLYLGEISKHNPKLNSTRRCSRAPNSWEWKSPVDEIRASLQILLPIMVEPKRAQMIHLAPTGEVHTWNAATDICVPDTTKKAIPLRSCKETKSGSCFAEPNPSEDSNLDEIVLI